MTRHEWQGRGEQESCVGLKEDAKRRNALVCSVLMCLCVCVLLCRRVVEIRRNMAASALQQVRIPHARVALGLREDCRMQTQLRVSRDAWSLAYGQVT